MVASKPDMGNIEGVPMLQDICDEWDAIHSFQARDGDVVVASYPKSGTTWMQEIMDFILQEGDVEKSLRAPCFIKVPFLELGKTYCLRGQESQRLHGLLLLLPKVGPNITRPRAL